MQKNQNLSPEAFIAVGKNRQRIYGENNVFMSDNQEFTIELYNPTSKTVGVKIYINGDSISSSMLVIRPAQRYFLERFVDTNNKLKFSTYTAEGDADVIKKAIQSNGIVRVEFFREYIPVQTYPTWIITNTTNPTWISTYPNWNNTYPNSSPETTSNVYYDSTSTFTCSTNENLRSFDSTKSIIGEDLKIETGRVEQGSVSSQSFNNYSGQFESFAFVTSQYQIMPESQRPVEVQETRVFCGNCNTRKKKSNWTFCPSCGQKF